MRTALFTLALLGAGFAPVMAQDVCSDRDPGLLSHFEGEWRSDGNAFGQPAQSTMQWGPVMDGCFWQLSYVIETNPDTDSANTFNGRGIHRHMEGSVSGQWIDNWGAMHDLRGSVSDTELIVFWGEATDQLGRSRYELTEDGAIQVTDWILTDEGWQQFNDNRFERVAD